MTVSVLFVVAVAISLLARRATGTWLHPLPTYFLLWGLIALLLIWNPVHLVTVAPGTIVLLLEGLGSLAVGGFVVILRFRGGAAATDSSQESVGAAPGRMAWGRVASVTGVALLVAVAGTYLVRGSIAAAAGQPYSNLSPTQIRALTVNSGASNAGLASIAYLLAPVVAALGIVLARRHWTGWLVAAVAIGVTALTPDRTFTVTTAVIALLFWLYSRPRATRLKHVRVIIVAALVAVGCVTYFLYEGGKLKQNTLITSRIPDAAIPSVLVPSFVYVTAGPPSLSAAMQEHLNPAYAEPWHSVWLLPRAAHLLDRSVQVPGTVDTFVPIPFDFNTYTWVGDVFFDFGTLGVIVLGFITGFAVCRVYAWADAHRTYAAQFAAAVMATLLFFSVINFRFLWLECAVWIIVGFVLLRVASQPRRETA